jgi:hypothetical protein
VLTLADLMDLVEGKKKPPARSVWRAARGWGGAVINRGRAGRLRP